MGETIARNCLGSYVSSCFFCEYCADVGPDGVLSNMWRSVSVTCGGGDADDWHLLVCHLLGLCRRCRHPVRLAHPCEALGFAGPLGNPALVTPEPQVNVFFREAEFGRAAFSRHCKCAF